MATNIRHLALGLSASQDDIWTTIRAASRVNNERRNAAILLGYMAKMSYAEIARAARISPSRVRQIVLAFIAAEN